MENIKISKKEKDFVKKYANYQNLGGFSNLSSNDLKKASRYDFQLTGLYGEVAWYLYRYNSYDKLKDLLEYKYINLNFGKGDGGEDDKITHNGITRLIDIKSSYITNLDKISRLNLIIPEKEFHKNIIYVCAFTIGETRENIDEVYLAGWTPNEDVTQKWFYDPKKYCVKIPNLRNLSSLKKILS